MVTAERYHSAEITYGRDGHEVELFQEAGEIPSFYFRVNGWLDSADDYHLGEAVGRPVRLIRDGRGRTHVAFWYADGVTHVLRNDEFDEELFLDVLRSLREVDAQTWKEARP